MPWILSAENGKILHERGGGSDPCGNNLSYENIQLSDDRHFISINQLKAYVGQQLSAKAAQDEFDVIDLVYHYLSFLPNLSDWNLGLDCHNRTESDFEVLRLRAPFTNSHRERPHGTYI